MNKLFLTKDNLKELIKNLKKDCDEFIAPKREHLDDIVFGDAKNDAQELLDYEGNSVISPRAFLLPQTEELFEIKSVRNSNFVPIEDKKKRIFYGVRPCDIKALTLMRKFFLDDTADAPYRERLEHSTFIALACSERCFPESFCAEMGSGPKAEEGYDLQLITVNGGYLVEIGSKKGNEIVNRNKGLFNQKASSAEKEAAKQLKAFTRPARKVNYRALAKAIREKKVKESVWDDIGTRCVVCSGCITLCPTCSCFSIIDRMDGRGGVRMRYCDGCPYAGFTRMAGGSTPFPRHRDHIRRFFEHKLDVDTARYGRPSCVGCSRCIRTCPGNISIKKFIEEVI